ncbi:MAG TPA: hypothetical protein VGJ91_05425 [Polyangiaceae bacterium]|jgi:hypothetical protein
MNLDDDDDSVFERALRADLPSLSEQNRLRQRILAAGVAAGTALGSTNVAAAAPTSLGASALSKLSALSWPAKVGLAAALAAPVAGLSLPQSFAPVPAAALVAQVRSRAAVVRAGAATKAALSPANALPLSAPQLAPAARAEPASEPAAANIAARAPLQPAAPALAPVSAPSNANPSSNPSPGSNPNPNPNPNPNGNADAAEPAVAAFDSVAHDAPGPDLERLPNSSTLAAETQLLDRAFAALAAGDRTTAATLVAEHARRFPNGLLRQERERARARLASDPKGE